MIIWDCNLTNSLLSTYVFRFLFLVHYYPNKKQETRNEKRETRNGETRNTEKGILNYKQRDLLLMISYKIAPVKTEPGLIYSPLKKRLI